MVSKRNILGKSPLIFITTGTTKYPFDRLNNALEKAFKYIHPASKIIFQGIASNWSKHQNVEYYNSIKPDEYIKILSKATHIVTQAGPGSLYIIAKHAKVFPFIIARTVSYKEHNGDHQVIFLEYIKELLKQDYLKYIAMTKNLDLQISSYFQAQPDRNILNQILFHESNKKNLLRKISSFISQITT